jgi:hypothetical protein
MPRPIARRLMSLTSSVHRQASTRGVCSEIKIYAVRIVDRAWAARADQRGQSPPTSQLEDSFPSEKAPAPEKPS